MKWRTEDGSTGRLLQYCAAYFLLYVVTGVSVKYFQGPANAGYPGFTSLQYLIFSTLSSALVCLGVIVAGGWFRGTVKSEVPMIMLSGACTAVVIPTTTLMYTLPISVMVAMVIMRGSVIVISRAVDWVLHLQGISGKKVVWQENVAAAVATVAVGLHLLLAKSSDFDFIHDAAATAILGSYMLAYAIRIYLMNRFKFTRSPASSSNNLSYFAVEQFTASGLMFGAVGAALAFPEFLPVLRETVETPPDGWRWAAVSGISFGASAFFSVFLFMFKGRSSTFAGLTNRLASLIAGTIATVISAAFFYGDYPKPLDWLSLALILVAVCFLADAEEANRGA
ncbi:MAG: hypothetical protein HUU37_05265 [Bdellovibrionales bacterium]|nr:hypothetical protein [Bdellovibrionales bacterium]